MLIHLVCRPYHFCHLKGHPVGLLSRVVGGREYRDRFDHMFPLPRRSCQQAAIELIHLVHTYFCYVTSPSIPTIRPSATSLHYQSREKLV